MTEDVLELLETKDFDELIEKEKNAVLKEMSESEYRDQRKLILTAFSMGKEEITGIVPNPNILLAAQQKVIPRRRPLGVIMLNHKVPTWLAIAACFLLFIGISVLYQSRSNNVRTEYVTETIVDTVYTEKIVKEEVTLPGDTIVKYIYVNEPEVIYQVVDNEPSYTREEPNYDLISVPQDQYCNIMSCYEAKKGNSAANDMWLKLAR